MPADSATYNDKESIELLSRDDVEINVSDIKGCTPLYVAVDNGYSEIVNILLASNAEVNVRNENGFTPLYVVPVRKPKSLLHEGLSIYIRSKNIKKQMFFSRSAVTLALAACKHI